MENVGIDVWEDVIKNLSTWIVVVGTGLIVWMIRQIIPDGIENSKVWKILLRLIPMPIGLGLAAIPALHPIADNAVQSMAVGFIGGSISQSVYDFFKMTVSKRMRAVIASKAGRNALKNGG